MASNPARKTPSSYLHLPIGRHLRCLYPENRQTITITTSALAGYVAWWWRSKVMFREEDGTSQGERVKAPSRRNGEDPIRFPPLVPSVALKQGEAHPLVRVALRSSERNVRGGRIKERSGSGSSVTFFARPPPRLTKNYANKVSRSGGGVVVVVWFRWCCCCFRSFSTVAPGDVELNRSDWGWSIVS